MYSRRNPEVIKKKINLNSNEHDFSTAYKRKNDAK